MFDKIIDALRMITLKSKPKPNIAIPICQRLYPKMYAAAQRGENRVIYYPSDGVVASTAHWVASRWDDIKSYLEQEGFDCQYYAETGEYHIIW